jgi:hypothetical protein
MESFVDHYFSINQTDYDMNMPLQSSKFIIDILSPLILFSLANDDNLLIHDTNHTLLSGPTGGTAGGRVDSSIYEYFMQFKIYPKYKQFIKQKENFCKRVVESFYPPEEHIDYKYGDDLDYETVKPFLEEYYHINEDPRQLISMRQSGNSVTYTKERWYEFILRMSPYCYGQFNTYYYHELTKWIESLSVNLPTDNIWKYLMAKKYY